MCSDSNLERCRCLDPHRVTLWCHAQATPPLFLFSFSISMKESNTAGSSLLFLDYTVQLKHSQCTHTYPYECKSANPISMSIFEEWVSKSSRLTKSSQMPRCWWKRHLPLIAQMLLNSRIFASIESRTHNFMCNRNSCNHCTTETTGSSLLCGLSWVFDACNHYTAAWAKPDPSTEAPHTFMGLDNG